VPTYLGNDRECDPVCLGSQENEHLAPAPIAAGLRSEVVEWTLKKDVVSMGFSGVAVAFQW
jgi:hypothetical protein